MEGRKKKFIKELMERPRLRRESGLYVVDGPKMCGELPAELVEELYVSEELTGSHHLDEKLKTLMAQKGFETVSAKEMKQISDTVTPQGIIAVVRQRRPRGLSRFLKQGLGDEEACRISGFE